jgi:AraC family transcriptional regulator
MSVGPRASDEYRRRICRAIDFINAHLAGNPSVAEIARAAPFSSFHFQRLFRAIVGETVAQFTRRVRLETAARRLRFRPHDEITGLAVDLGFSSSQNFAKAFKKHFDVSPTQYREQFTGAPAGVASGAEPVERDWIRAAGDAESIAKSVEVRDVPAVRVVYRRHFGSYNHPGVEAAFDELVRWARPCGLDGLERYIGIPWDDADVTTDAKCRFDACLIVPDGFAPDRGINWQTIPAGRYAVYSCQIVHHDFDAPWTALMRDWLPHSGYLPADGPRFEVYHSDGRADPEGRWRIDVSLPVVRL